MALAAALLPLAVSAQPSVQLTTLHVASAAAADGAPAVSGRFVRVHPLVSGDVRVWAGPVSPVYTDVLLDAADATQAAPIEAALVFGLGDAFPNPVTARATVPFTLATPSPARLTVHDMLGREVAVLVDGDHPEGRHTATLHARGLAAGVYVVRLDAGDATRLARITIVR